MGEACSRLRTFCGKLFCRSKVDDPETKKGVNNLGFESRRITSTERRPDHDTEFQPRQPPESEVYTALWSFEARAHEELSFEEGDRFRIMEQIGDWWAAEKIDQRGHILATGYVPYNYLAIGKSVEAEPWYFGKMSRYQALKYLMSPENEDGAFLVRLSEKDDIGYVLSVKYNNEAKHFKIHEREGCFYVDHTQIFTSILKLVEHYKLYPGTSISNLTSPCIKKEPKPHYLSYSTVDEYELPKEDFIMEELLGYGYFADVYRGKWKNRINVAIKVIKNDMVNQREIQMEIQNLKRLRHRHLITLFAVCTSCAPYYIITELMEKGNLLQFLQGPESRDLEKVYLIEMSTQVADGMAYLESQNSIHRDLAARNVLVGENYICKVADFGLARIIKESVYISRETKIPYKWCAPEAISHGRFSSKSDIWSFGVLLYEIFSYGGIPYPAYSSNEVLTLITDGYRMPAPRDCPKHIYDIMMSCWNDTPEDRPNFSDLKYQLQNLNSYETEWD